MRMRTRTRLAGAVLAAGTLAGGLAFVAPAAQAAPAHPAGTVRPADTTVTAYHDAGVLAGPYLDQPQLSAVHPGYTYTGLCWTTGDTVNDVGLSSDIWIELSLNSGGVGYVPAIYLKGDAYAGVPNEC